MFNISKIRGTEGIAGRCEMRYLAAYSSQRMISDQSLLFAKTIVDSRPSRNMYQNKSTVVIVGVGFRRLSYNAPIQP